MYEIAPIPPPFLPAFQPAISLHQPELLGVPLPIPALPDHNAPTSNIGRRKKIILHLIKKLVS